MYNKIYEGITLIISSTIKVIMAIVFSMGMCTFPLVRPDEAIINRK